MKTPKVQTPHPKKALSAFREGKVSRKSLGSITGKKLSNLSSIIKSEVYNDIIGNEENVQSNLNKKKKGRMSLPANAFQNSANKASNNNASYKALSPGSLKKAKRKSLNAGGSPKSELGKNIHLQNKTSPVNSKLSQSENNTSPIKPPGGSRKKVKVSFGLGNDIQNKDKPTKVHKFDKKESLGSIASVGNRVVETLSPKSGKAKRKRPKKKLQLKEKVEVEKTDASLNDSNLSPVPGEDIVKKKRTHRGRRARKVPKVQRIPSESIFKNLNVKNALKALLSCLNSSKSEQKDLFDDDKYIYLHFSLFKVNPKLKGIAHIALPNLILPDSPDICLITSDLKRNRNDPDEGIDVYKDLLKKNEIDYVTEIIPLWKINADYSQYEAQRKLANRFDSFLYDSKIGRIGKTGKIFFRAKKNLTLVILDKKDLKAEFNKALRKVSLYHSGGGHSFSVKCGRIGMSIEDICENIIKIGEFLANDMTFVGDKINVQYGHVSTSKSSTFPIFASTVSPNDVPMPKDKEQKPAATVTGEVTTVEGGTVVVYPSGRVKVKKEKNAKPEAKESEQQQKSKVQKKEPTISKKMLLKKEEIEDDSDDDSSVESLTESMLDELEDGEFEDDDEAIDSDADDISDIDDAEDNDSDIDDDDNKNNDSDIDDDESDEADSNLGLAADSDSDSADESDESDAEIDAAEREYLKEVRLLQDELSKNRSKLKAKGKKSNPVTVQETNNIEPIPKQQKNKNKGQKASPVKENSLNTLSNKGQKGKAAKQNNLNTVSNKGQKASPVIHNNLNNLSHKGQKARGANQNSLNTLSNKGQKASGSNQNSLNTLSNKGQKTSGANQNNLNTLSNKGQKAKPVNQNNLNSVPNKVQKNNSPKQNMNISTKRTANSQMGSITKKKGKFEKDDRMGLIKNKKKNK